LSCNHFACCNKNLLFSWLPLLADKSRIVAGNVGLSDGKSICFILDSLLFWIFDCNFEVTIDFKRDFCWSDQVIDLVDFDQPKAQRNNNHLVGLALVVDVDTFCLDCLRSGSGSVFIDISKEGTGIRKTYHK
jgi:hypothetical protein